MRSLSSFPALLTAASLLASAAPAQAQELLPVGSPIAEGVGLDATEAGINAILELAQDFIPPDMVIGTTPDQGFPIEDPLFGFLICTQYFRLENLVIHTEMNSMTIEADEDSLDLVVDLNMWINEPVGGWPDSGDDDDSSAAGDDDDSAASTGPVGPAVIVFHGDNICMDYVCFLYTEPANLVLRIPISLALSADAQGDPFVDVTFGALEHNIAAAMEGKIHLTDCALGNTNEWLAENLGLDMFDLVLSVFEGEIESQYQGAVEGFEETIEDALRGLWLQDTIDILDTSLSYDLQPTEFQHNDLGLRTVLGGSFSTEDVAECVAQYELGGSRFTPSQMPAMTAVVPSSGQEYHFAGIPADDFINQALFALWQGGVMCYVIDDAGGTLPMNTDLLSLLLGLENTELLGELFFRGPVAMVIRTVPETPPDARFDGEQDINIQIDGLGIEFYPIMQDRLAHLATVAIDIAAGINLSIGPDGALLLDLHLDTDNLNARVTYNEIAPALNPILESNFGSFLGVVIDTVGGSLLEGIAMALPTFGGIGATALDLEAIGSSPSLLDFLGAYMLLGESTGGESSGCDGCGDDGGGCDASGCDAAGCGGEEGGCDAAGCGEGGCELSDAMADSGCSGETSSQPEDTGCQGCDVLPLPSSHSHWRATITRDGVRVDRVQHRVKIRLGAPQVLALLLPIVWLSRRRRAHGEC